MTNLVKKLLLILVLASVSFLMVPQQEAGARVGFYFAPFPYYYYPPAYYYYPPPYAYSAYPYAPPPATTTKVATPPKVKCGKGMKLYYDPDADQYVCMSKVRNAEPVEK